MAEGTHQKEMKAGTNERKVSGFIPAMLAKETDKPFDDDDWIFEVKWDGYRAIAELNKNTVKLYSRNGISFNLKYPEVTAALKKLDISAVLDGEIVALNEKGNADFQLLQHISEHPDAELRYYIFDILRLGKRDLQQMPLLQRKGILRDLFADSNILHFSDHVSGQGKKVFAFMKKQGLEGMMAKKSDSTYRPGFRTGEWLKVKNHKTMDAIICGFTAPRGGRKFFGALILGVKNRGEMVYIGHTGTGFSSSLLKEIGAKLKRMVTNVSPFRERIITNSAVTWVKPVYVCEVKFTEKTRGGLLRHPAFLRLRDDKTTEETTMKAAKTEHGHKNIEASPVKSKVGISNPEKIFWPKEGITKMDVVEYYRNIAPWILPYLKNRPQSMKRNPDGINDPGFFQKDAGHDLPAFVKSVEVYSESTKRNINYLVCNNKDTLAYMNNLGCIEINPWHSRITAPDKPDYLVIDIDPSGKNTFSQVIETALAVHEVLESAAIPNYCKTSGATGLHIYIPAGAKYTYDQLRLFAELVCMRTHELVPRFTSMERNLKKRGNKIYLDHLQNRRGQTIASVYSLRPVAGAKVSTPLLWKEVKPGLDPADFNIFTIRERIESVGDLFEGILAKGFNMRQSLEKLNADDVIKA